MESCNCIEPQWPAEELLMKYQYISDFFIALAYFSIPLELIYFVKKSAVFPYRWVLVQFGAFIVLCGATHLINLWTFNMHSRTVAVVMTTSKVLTAVVSCVTALMLVHIIPDLLSVKTRELFLKNKAAELDREMGLIRTQEETGRHVRMLTHEIRSTLDRHTILKTTLVELGRTLVLEECALWMPTRTGLELQLSYTLRQQNPVGYTVPIQLPVAVALSHAAILEESMRARDLLMEQNVALDHARREAETAIRARNDFLAVMNHEMRTPMHAIIALSSSLLQETELTPEQRLMVETILKSSNLLATLINDVLDLSRLEDGSLQLDLGTFNLHALFREVLNLIKPIASVKKLHVNFSDAQLMIFFLSDDAFSVPGVGDEYHLTSGTEIPVAVDLALQFVRVLLTLKLIIISTSCMFVIRFVNLMEGHIWIESEGFGKGCTVIFHCKAFAFLSAQMNLRVYSYLKQIMGRQVFQDSKFLGKQDGDRRTPCSSRVRRDNLLDQYSEVEHWKEQYVLLKASSCIVFVQLHVKPQAAKTVPGKSECL
ncbi:hypothetical protein D5086_006169 [Populus alba]|uniref:Uncharacterized protein n=1 Tax=Populus alba TaxID=43335 RepID=A0ACC4CL85_POPAL